MGFFGRDGMIYGYLKLYLPAIYLPSSITIQMDNEPFKELLLQIGLEYIYLLLDKIHT